MIRAVIAVTIHGAASVVSRHETRQLTATSVTAAPRERQSRRAALVALSKATCERVFVDRFCWSGIAPGSGPASP